MTHSHSHTRAAATLPADEAALLGQVRRHPALATLADCSAHALAQLTRSHGIDFATALFFDRLAASPRHRPFIERVDAHQHVFRSNTPVPKIDAALVIVPGAYYLEYPQFGGDGRLLREVAEPMGIRTHLIPLPSTSPLRQSAALINEFLRKLPRQRILLASLSKGSADVKAALQLPDAADAFANVTHWLDLSGISDGTPLATRLVNSLPLTVIGRTWFWLHNYNWQMLRDLADHPDSLLRDPIVLPAHIRAIHLLGVPLTRHVTTARARRDHRRLAAYGPNDGCGLLAHALQWPGDIYPVWGADHYLRPPERMRSLAAAVLREACDSKNFGNPAN